MTFWHLLKSVFSFYCTATKQKKLSLSKYQSLSRYGFWSLHIAWSIFTLLIIAWCFSTSPSQLLTFPHSISSSRFSRLPLTYKLPSVFSYDVTQPAVSVNESFYIYCRPLCLGPTTPSYLIISSLASSQSQFALTCQAFSQRITCIACRSCQSCQQWATRRDSMAQSTTHVCVYAEYVHVSECKYAKYTDVTVSHSSSKVRDVKDVVQPCWFEGVKGRNRQRASKSYKHWSSWGSGAGLEEQLLNIQRHK